MMQNNGQFFIGVVEDRNDPLMLGRVRVRVVGLHFYDKTVLPTEDLPWAMIMQPLNGGTAMTATAPAEGMTVIVIFNDYPVNQQPIVIGMLAGIPQGNPVTIDRPADEPLYRDDITPSGRPLPKSSAETTGNQTGPVDDPNPTLESIRQQSIVESANTSKGVIDNLINIPTTTFGGVGGIASTIGGLGTVNSPRNEFENLLTQFGNVDSATQSYAQQLASQAGIFGSLAPSFIRGRNSTLDSYNRFTEFLPDLQESIHAIVSTRVNFPQIEREIDEFLQIGNTVNSAIIEIENRGLRELRELGRGLDLPELAVGMISDIAGEALGKLGNLPINTSSIGQILTNPNSIATALNGQYASSTLIPFNPGNISVTTQKPLTDITSADFAKVAEGSTPPINGSYGGPNYAGATAPIEVPKIDTDRFVKSTNEINTNPPPSWRGNRTRAQAGIDALLKACDKWGLSTPEQKASLLGIVGGECNWIPQEESAQYSSPDRLLQIFPTTFKGDRTLAEKYCNWVSQKKGTKEQFFNFVYDPANNGRQIGNIIPGDGGRFYGRGFIQLIGRANYERYEKLSGHRITIDPDLLVRDMEVSAEIAVLYFLDRVKNVVPTAHPGYFYAAKKAVGRNSLDIANRKLAYYEHFYGTRTPEGYGYCEKEAGNSINSFSYFGAVSGNESGQPRLNGFQDPHGKYPLKRYVNEPEVSRIARGVVKETVVTLKESKRTLNVPLPFGMGSFSQPTIPYGAKYPYNNVRETESGHIQEFDDTPGYERIHTYHRSGTFEEIDATGTKVTKIVGDGYVLFDRNGFISIAGDANVTVDGNVNIYCRSDANIEVEGSAEMKVHGNMDIGVGRDMNVAVQGNLSMWANGSMNLQSKKAVHLFSTEDNLYATANKQIHLLSVDDMYIHSRKNQHVDVGSDYYLKTGRSWNTRTGTSAFLNTGQSTHILAEGNVEVDGTITNINSGTALGSALAKPALKAVVHGMVPPAIGAPVYPKVEAVVTPTLLGEDTQMFETPEEGALPVSTQYIDQLQKKEGISNTTEGEVSKATGGASTVITPSRRDIILATQTFTADFKLSEHFTLGMMFDGGFNGKHKLVAQNGLTVPQIVANLSMLCENVLEKYLEILPGGIQGYRKEWFITSGYRMGTNRSDHSRGRAVDIQLAGRSKKRHFEMIKELDKLVPYDQLILEYAGTQSVWIHTSLKTDTFGGGNNRRMAFTMRDHRTYKQGFALLG